jgi:septal ring factor EnvC (AmiA/AmiB activator)
MTVQETRGTQQTAITVNLTGDTTYTKQAKTDTKAIATGMCILATGKADSTGALAATAVRLSAPVNGACTAGFGRRNASGSRSGG